MNIIFVAHNCNISFIENELVSLINNPSISQLKIYTDFPIDNVNIAFHDKCIVTIYSRSNYPLLKIRKWPLIIREFFANLVWYIRNNRLRELNSILRDHLRKASVIFENGIGQTDVLYSYWAGSSAFILSSLKLHGLRNLFVTRLHGFDLYLDGSNKGHIPWRKFIFSKVNFLLPVSKFGEHYLLRNYPDLFAEKTRTSYLGINTEDPILNLINSDDGNLKLVSCGWVGNHKNLKGIFDSLKNESSIEWTHIGDGEHFEQLKQHVSTTNCLKVNLVGKKSQKELMSYYRNNPITCFISLSPNEGLPVSMMEAMAHGIPVVSTDVGGCSEIVNENTGVLLPKNYTDEDVRKAVYLCAQKFRTREARQKIQDFIKENFDAEKNYGKFVDFLKAENKKHHEKL